MIKKTSDDKLDQILQKLDAQEKEMGYIRNAIGDMNKAMCAQFDSWDQKFFEFKSDIHNLIDYGFSSKAKTHDEEIDILNFRTTELREDVEKLNNVVFQQ